MDFKSYIEFKADRDFDMNMIEAFGAYFLLGLNPGSFGEACLLGDLNKAYRSAHHLLYKYGNDIVPNHIEFCQALLPEECQGSKKKIDEWMNHGGLKFAPMIFKLQLKLTYGTELWPFKVARYEMATAHIWACEHE